MSRLRLALLSGAVVIVIGLLAFAGWTWRHPSTFDAYGGWGVGDRDHSAGETLYVGFTYPDDGAGGTVTIHGADPHGLLDSTNATIAYFVCTPDTGPNGAAIGSGGESDVREECTDLRPVDEDTPLSLAHDQLLVAVTPLDVGVVSFHGVDLHYSDGWQNGTQRIGGDVRVRVRDDS